MHQPTSESENENRSIPTLNFFFSLMPHTTVTDITPKGWLQCVINIGRVEVVLEKFSLPFVSPMNLKTKFKVMYTSTSSVAQCILHLKNKEIVLPEKAEIFSIQNNTESNPSPSSAPPVLPSCFQPSSSLFLPHQPVNTTPLTTPNTDEKTHWAAHIKPTNHIHSNDYILSTPAHNITTSHVPLHTLTPKKYRHRDQKNSYHSYQSHGIDLTPPPSSACAKKDQTNIYTCTTKRSPQNIVSLSPQQPTVLPSSPEHGVLLTCCWFQRKKKK